MDSLDLIKASLINGPWILMMGSSIGAHRKINLCQWKRLHHTQEMSSS